MSTTLTFHMTPNFVLEATGQANGMGSAPVWAYLWLDKPPADTPISDVFTSGPYANPGATNNTTPLIINGSLTPNVTLVDGYYQVTVSLTDSAYQYVNGGAAYFLLQSEPLASHHDLPTNIGSSVGNIQPNSQAWNFGYAAFEYSLLGQGSDQGDLTAIDGWGPNLGVKVSYSNGTSDERGSNLTGQDLLGLLTPLNGTANHTYTAAGSPLNGDSALFVSPSNGFFNKTASPLWPTTIWDTQPDGTGTGYLTAFAALTDVTLSGVSNGEPDANGIWHNSQYYEYTVSSLTLAANTGTNGWGAAGTYFLFSPSSSSQTKGYMLISAATLQENLYAAGQGTATMWSTWDSTTPTNSVPYVIPGSGQPSGTAATDNSFNPSANNQYGTIFTNLFTGFTAGYWGSVANQANPFSQGATGPDNLGAGSVNLDDSRNWASAYAFDGNRDTTASPKPTYQHYDPYSKIFFENTNVYGSAFSDNLSSGLTPGPLIALSQPGSGSGTSPSNNVTNIDLYVYASIETGNYTEPVGANYLKPLGADYLIPTQTSGLSVLVNGQAAGLLIREDATIKLGIYTGKNGSGHATFDYVTVETGGNLWQNFSVTGSAGSWSAGADAADPNPPAVGTFVINDLPSPASPAVGGVYWYQLVVGDDTGDQKVYDFYATAASTSPGVISTSDLSVAAGGGATFPPGTLTSSQIQLALNPASTMPSGLLDFVYNSQFSPMPAAPVAGTLAGLVFTAIDGQNGTGILDTISNTTVTPAILIASASATLAFGWTGTNNGTHSGTPTGSISTGLPTNGLISKFTNKINAGDVARITVVDAATNTALGTTVSGTADLDGQWQTWGGAGPATVTLAEGIYSATMMEMMPNGTTPYGSATGTQSAPLYILVSSTSSYADTAAHISNALVALEALETQVGSPFPVTVSDNGLIAMNFAGIAGYANVLLQTTNANSTPYELAISDSSATIVTNIAALNSNTHVKSIGFTDAGIPTLTFTNADYTAYGTAIGEMVGQRTIVVTGTSGTFSSFQQDYRHGVLASGANGSGVLVLTREFATNYTGGNITGAPNYEHDTDSMGRTVLDYYSSPVNTNAITVATGALPLTYQSGGAARSTFTTVTYEYANGVATPASSAYTYFNPGPGGSTGEEDVFDVNGNLIEATLVGFNPTADQGKAASSTFYEMINSVPTTVATGTHYEYTTAQPDTNYTDLVDKWDTSSTPRLLKQVFSGLSGPESNFFSSYEYHYLGGVLSGSKYVLAPVTGQQYTGGEIHLDGDGNLSKIVVTGITSEAYSSYEYDYAYANGAYGGGGVVGQKYYFTNIEGQSYTTREVDLDAAGNTTKVVYSGYTVTGSQPYSSLEYDYSGGNLTGSKGYVTNISGKWTGEVHEFNAMGQLVSQMYTGVTNQTSTSYEFEYANGDGVLTGKNFYFTDIVNQGYSSYEYSYDAGNTLTLATYNMNDGGHVLNGQGISQTINSIYNDTMTGGGGSDTFAFTPYFGQAIITDFSAADDIISLPGSEFAGYTYVQNNSTLVAGNMVITGTNGDTLTLQGVTTLPGSTDFLFV